MSDINALLESTTKLVFIALGFIALIEYLRYRGEQRRDILLMFGSIALTLVVSAIDDVFGNSSGVLSTIGFLILVTQPYWLIRLTQYFHRVPQTIKTVAIIGMAISWIAILLINVVQLPWMTVYIVSYFLLINGYAMSIFYRQALRTSGVTLQRLRFTAIGSGLLAITLFWYGVTILIPQFSATISLLLWFSGIGSGVSFYLGLASPRWLRHVWQLEELRKFLLQSTREVSTETTEAIYNNLIHSACEATDAVSTAIFVQDDTSNSWTVYDPDKPMLDVSDNMIPLVDQFWEAQTNQVVPVDKFDGAFLAALGLYNVDLAYIIPLSREAPSRELMFVLLENGSLFVDDDLQILSLFVEQSCILLENLELVRQLRIHTGHLEQQVEKRTSELQKQNTYMYLLQQISLQANEATTIEDPILKAIELICKNLSLSIGHAFAPTDESLNQLVSTDMWYMDNPEKYELFYAKTKNLEIIENLGGVGEALGEGKPIWYIDVSQQNTYWRADVAREVGLVTGIFIPILIQNETVAVLEFYADQPLEPNADLMDTVTQVGTQLGRVIERKRAEMSLHESEQRFRTIANAAPIPLVISRISDGEILFANPASSDIHGIPTNEFIGMKALDIYENPEDRSGLIETIRRQGFADGYEVRIKTVDGKLLWVSTTIKPIVFEGEDAFFSTFIDVTDRKQAQEELLKLNSELEKRVRDRTAHLTAVNQELEAFSYSVSHDLRAPLRAVDGFSQALLEDYYDVFDDIGKDFLNRIRTESQRMGQLIDDLIALSRYTRSDMELQQVDLSEMARDQINELKQQNPDRSVHVSIQDNLIVQADYSLMQVVLQNLLNNAWKYSAKTANAKIEFGSRNQGGVCEYYVRDNGAGFDMAYVDKLFGAFQRLHAMDEFEGTGIGLATVQRIIHRHGGTVRAEGEINKGATFYFTVDDRHENK